MLLHNIICVYRYLSLHATMQHVMHVTTVCDHACGHAN